MKYDNFLQELKSLNPQMYVRVVAEFGNRDVSVDEYTFSNVEVFTQGDYGLGEDEFNIVFSVIDCNYSTRVLTVGKLIDVLMEVEGKSEIERFTISPEPESDLPCPHFDLWPGSESRLKTKIITDDLVEIYLDHKS